MGPQDQYLVSPIHSTKVSERFSGWSTDLLLSNTAFFDGNHAEQDPFYTIDGSVEYKYVGNMGVCKCRRRDRWSVNGERY